MKTSKDKKPLRTCVACGKNDAKNGFVRFVRSANGEVSCDASGRLAGRGAYLCASEDCFMKATKQGRLNRALRCQLSGEDHQRLEEAFKDSCQSFLAK